MEIVLLILRRRSILQQLDRMRSAARRGLQ
jgi:hypothetical protein